MHSFILPNDWIYVASSLNFISGLLNLILFMIIVVERGNCTKSAISTPNQRFGNKFLKKI